MGRGDEGVVAMVTAVVTRTEVAMTTGAETTDMAAVAMTGM